MDADGSGQTNLTSNAASDEDPSWQPRSVDGDVTVTKVVVDTPPPGTTFTVKVDCDGEQDDKTLTFPETGGTQRSSASRSARWSARSPSRTAARRQSSSHAQRVRTPTAKDNGSFDLFDHPGGDDTSVEITVSNTFAVVAEPTFTG
jgi:hypothetical protein